MRGSADLHAAAEQKKFQFGTSTNTRWSELLLATAESTSAMHIRACTQTDYRRFQGSHGAIDDAAEIATPCRTQRSLHRAATLHSAAKTRKMFHSGNPKIGMRHKPRFFVVTIIMPNKFTITLLIR